MGELFSVSDPSEEFVSIVWVEEMNMAGEQRFS